MFSVDNVSFTTQYLYIRRVSRSTFNPTMTVVDQHGNEVRYKVPYSITNRIHTVLKATKFLEPWPCYVLFADNDIVCIDIPSKETLKLCNENNQPWESVQIDKNLQALFEQCLNGSWMFDKQFVYRQAGEVSEIPNSNFGTVTYVCYDLTKMYDSDHFKQKNRTGFAYWDSFNYQWTITSPLTQQAGTKLQLGGDSDEGNEMSHTDVTGGIEHVNRYVFPNLMFVTYAARAISNNFGYEAIEPLGLPLLMVEHQTFNIGKVPNGVARQSPAPMTFTQTIAWLTGLFRSVETIDQLVAIKGCFKYLMKKGSYKVPADREENNERSVVELRKLFADQPDMSLNPDVSMLSSNQDEFDQPVDSIQ